MQLIENLVCYSHDNLTFDSYACKYVLFPINSAYGNLDNDNLARTFPLTGFCEWDHGTIINSPIEQSKDSSETVFGVILYAAFYKENCFVEYFWYMENFWSTQFLGFFSS